MCTRKTRNAHSTIGSPASAILQSTASRVRRLLTGLTAHPAACPPVSIVMTSYSLIAEDILGDEEFAASAVTSSLDDAAQEMADFIAQYRDRCLARRREPGELAGYIWKTDNLT
jgi:hypothetical protein